MELARSGGALELESDSPEVDSFVMLLFPTILVAAFASFGSRWMLEAPQSQRLPQPRSFPSVTGWALQSCALAADPAACAPRGKGARLAPLFGRNSRAWRADILQLAHGEQKHDDAAQARAGFLHLDLFAASRFGAGPEVGWATVDAPQENLLRQRLVTPGIGVWYSPFPAPVFLGISANTWVSTLGETWFVNALSSEARFGFEL